MELAEFNKQREVARNSNFECEHLEILELDDIECLDKESGLVMNLLYDLARNENISDKVQLLLAVKVLDSSYSTQELKKYLVGNKNLSDTTFETLLNQNDIFLFYYILEYLNTSDIRKTQILKKLDNLGLTEIKNESDLNEHIHSFSFSEAVQNQILDHEYHLEEFMFNPHLTELVQLRIVQSNSSYGVESGTVTYIGRGTSENTSDDDYFDVDDYYVESKYEKKYFYQLFCEKNKNISELALIALFNKNDKRVLITLSKRTELPNVMIYKFIEKTEYNLIYNIIEFNQLDSKFQMMILGLNNNELSLLLSKKEWIDLDTILTLTNLNDIRILDNLSSSKSPFIYGKLKKELEMKFTNHPDYSNYKNEQDDFLF